MEFGYITVPCGHCVNCRKEHAKEWKIRLLHESQYHEFFQFVTLTYDDDHLVSPSLVKSDLQKFFKRLRKNTGSKFKYFACGEYGPKTFRPHYHFIIFAFFPVEVYQSCWPLGFVKVGNKMSDKSLSYVSGYVDKKVCERPKDYIKKGLVPPFLLSSQGLGLQWCLDNSKLLLEQGYIRYNGFPCPIPRYYRKKLGIYNNIDYFIQYQKKLDLDMSSKGYDPSVPNDKVKYFEKVYYSALQTAINHKAKLLLTKEVL